MYNPGFEIYNKCPEDYVVKHRKVLIPGWDMPTLGTADYFNMCANKQVGVPKNFMGYSLPQEGIAYVGLILLLDPPDSDANTKSENYREYLQTKLIKALGKNKQYDICLYFAVSSYSTFAVNRLGIYLSEKKIGNKFSTGILKCLPQIETDSLKIDKEHFVWFTLKGKYIAKGGEKYLTIGNFYDDYKTHYVLCDLTELSSVKKTSVLKDRIAYYYFDNISVTESFNK